jgi:hypothetical protein
MPRASRRRSAHLCPQGVIEDALLECGLAVERLETITEQVAPYAEHGGENSRPEGRPNIVGVRAGSGGGRSLLLNGHVDTVGAGDPAFWTHPPLSGTVVDDLLYGLGACDMKGGLATVISALGALDFLGIYLVATSPSPRRSARRIPGSAPSLPCSRATRPTRRFSRSRHDCGSFRRRRARSSFAPPSGAGRFMQRRATAASRRSRSSCPSSKPCGRGLQGN